MKIKLSTELELGTRRGGEDLFLVVTITSKEEPRPDLLAPMFQAAFEEALAKHVKEDENVFDEDADLYYEEGMVLCEETEYGFQLRQTVDELRTQVERVALEGDWVKVLKTGEYRVESRILVDGNAD